MRDRIWAIRSSISRLEEAKDKIAGASGSGLAPSDAKEAYYATVSAWEMLGVASEGKGGGADDARWALETARSRAAQCASALGDHPALQSEFASAFDRCDREITAALDAVAPRREQPPDDVLAKHGDDEYRLLCSVCGAPSWSIRRGGGPDGTSSLRYTGICGSMALAPEDAPAVFGLLARHDIDGAHRYLYDKYARTYDMMGIDAYCPECRTTYCGFHYNAREEFDEGFYDCTYGICPRGHKRLLND